MKIMHRDNRWLPGTISERTGPLSFRVALSDSRIIRCHQDQLRSRMEVEESPVTEENHEVDIGPTLDDTSMTQATYQLPVSDLIKSSGRIHAGYRSYFILEYAH